MCLLVLSASSLADDVAQCRREIPAVEFSGICIPRVANALGGIDEKDGVDGLEGCVVESRSIDGLTVASRRDSI